MTPIAMPHRTPTKPGLAAALAVRSRPCDGSGVLCMKVAPAGELMRWVMQFGPAAEVLAPRSFREVVARELRAAAKAYGVARKGSPR